MMQGEVCCCSTKGKKKNKNVLSMCVYSDPLTTDISGLTLLGLQYPLD